LREIKEDLNKWERTQSRIKTLSIVTIAKIPIIILRFNVIFIKTPPVLFAEIEMLIQKIKYKFKRLRIFKNIFEKE
jgi:hypothetical protein